MDNTQDTKCGKTKRSLSPWPTQVDTQDTGKADRGRRGIHGTGGIDRLPLPDMAVQGFFEFGHDRRLVRSMGEYYCASHECIRAPQVAPRRVSAI